MTEPHLAPNHIPGLLLDLPHPGVEIANGLVQAGQALLGGEERVDVVHHVQIGAIQRIAARQHLIKVIEKLQKNCRLAEIAGFPNFAVSFLLKKISTKKYW
jgi:hypothetical protein